MLFLTYPKYSLLQWIWGGQLPASTLPGKRDGKGEKQTSLLTAQKGNYNLLFDAIYDSLRNQAAYPITIDQIKWQIEALQAPDFSL